MKKAGRKKIVRGIVLICIAGLIAAGAAAVRVRGSVRVGRTCLNDTRYCNVRYRQDDIRWAEDRMGDTSYRLKGSGCLVTCIAAVLSVEETVTPGELNAEFSRRDVYDAEANIQWGVFDRMEEVEVDVYGKVTQREIEECLENGCCPILRVRRHVLGGSHFVLVVGVENHEFICMDPLEDELCILSDYGGLVYSLRCVRPARRA